MGTSESTPSHKKNEHTRGTFTHKARKFECLSINPYSQDGQTYARNLHTKDMNVQTS